MRSASATSGGQRHIARSCNVIKYFDLMRCEQCPEEVREVLALSGQESFFTLPGWFRLVAEHGLDAGSKAYIAVNCDTSIGMACRHEPSGRVLRSCTNLYSCAFDIIAGRPDTRSVHAFFRELIGTAGSLDGVRLEGFDPESAHFPIILDGLRAAGLVAKPYFAWGNWFEPTSGMAFEQFLSTRSSPLRNTWTRKRAAVMKSARTQFRFHERDEDIEPFISAYEQVREQSWKEPEPYPAFIPGLIRFAAGLRALRSGILIVDGVSAAAQFWILWGGRATIYKLVHAEKFADISPGTILTMEMIRRVLGEDRPTEVDFGRGDDDYKKLWLTRRRELWGIEAANPHTWRGLSSALRIGASRLRDRTLRRNADSFRFG